MPTYIMLSTLTPEDEELTPTMKLKRSFVNKRYAVEINAITMKVSLAMACERAGLPMDGIAAAIRAGRLSFAFMEASPYARWAVRTTASVTRGSIERNSPMISPKPLAMPMVAESIVTSPSLRMMTFVPDRVSVVGTNRDDFLVSSNTCQDGAVDPGASCEVRC